jgi:hypothetical protein
MVSLEENGFSQYIINLGLAIMSIEGLFSLSLESWQLLQFSSFCQQATINRF